MPLKQSELEEYERLYRYAKDPYSVYDNVGDDLDVDVDVETVSEEKDVTSKKTKTVTEKSNSISKRNEFIKVVKKKMPAEKYEWQRRYIEAINCPFHTPSEALERARLIQDIQKEFIETAGSIVKTIVNESALPDDLKSIKKLDLKGVAGGEKYISKGIYFKYAIDWMNIYGTDQFAAKAAGAEMRALRCVNSVSLREAERMRRECENDVDQDSEPDVVIAPLSTVVDYMGQRIIASALIAINDDTLIYGSADQGQHIEFDETAHRAIQSFANHFHLATHKVFDRTARRELSLSIAVDSELHRGTDGRLYIVDAARMFPPTYPPMHRWVLPGKPTRYAPSHLFEHFRPEFLVSEEISSLRLSSDAMSSFQNVNEGHVQSRKVKRATSILLEQRIPEAVKFLMTRKISGSSALRSDWEDPDRICNFLHTRGINIRYFGVFRKELQRQTATVERNSKYTRLSNTILGEMIARTAKHILRARLRDAPAHDRRKVILDFFNALQGRVATDGHLEASAKVLWQQEIPRILECKFKGGLTESEKHSDLRPEDPHFFFGRVATLCGITFRSTAGHKHDLEILEDERWSGGRRKKGRGRKKGRARKKRSVFRSKDAEMSSGLLLMQRSSGLMKKISNSQSKKLEVPMMQAAQERMMEVPMMQAAQERMMEAPMMQAAQERIMVQAPVRKMRVQQAQKEMSPPRNQKSFLDNSTKPARKSTGDSSTIQLKSRYGGQVKLKDSDLMEISVRCKPFYSHIMQSQADAYHAAASYLFDEMKRSDVLSTEKAWRCEEFYKRSFEIFEQTFETQPDDPKIAVDYAAALLQSVRNPLSQKPIRRREQALIMIQKAQDLFSLYRDDELRDDCEQVILKELFLSAYDSVHRIRSDRVKYTIATRQSVNKAVEIMKNKRLDKIDMWANAMSKFSEFLDKTISLADLDISLRKILKEENKDMFTRVSDKGFCEVVLEFGNTYNNCGQWRLFVKLCSVFSHHDEDNSDDLEMRHLGAYVKRVEARLHETFRKQHIRFKIKGSRADWGTAKSSGTFDIPIRLILDPNLNAGKFVQTTMGLAIDCSKEVLVQQQGPVFLRFDKATSNEVRFRAAIPDDFDWDDATSDSDDELMEEE